MKKDAPVITGLGVALMLVGGTLTFTTPTSEPDHAVAVQCERKMRARGEDMRSRCHEATFANAVTARNANQAAAAISAANNKELAGNAAGILLLAFGLVLAGVGGVTLINRARDRELRLL